MTTANKINVGRIVESANGEAGIKTAKDEPKIYLFDRMRTYKENQTRGG